jgi:hypothetical protein
MITRGEINVNIILRAVKSPFCVAFGAVFDGMMRISYFRKIFQKFFVSDFQNGHGIDLIFCKGACILGYS